MKTALYRYYDTDNVLHYVGISVNPFNRCEQHGIWRMCDITRIEIEWFDTRDEAEQAEALAIQIESPLLNKKGEVINFYEWRFYAFANKVFPFCDGITTEISKKVCNNIYKGCIARGWLVDA